MHLLTKVRVRKAKDPHGRRIRGKKRVLPGGRNRIAKETGQSPNGLKGRRGKQPIKIGKKARFRWNAVEREQMVHKILVEG